MAEAEPVDVNITGSRLSHQMPYKVGEKIETTPTRWQRGHINL